MQQTIARHGKLTRPRAWTSLLKLAAAALAVVTASTIAVVGVATWSLVREVKPGIHLVGEETVPPVGAIEGGFNFLLVGNDGGEGDPEFGVRGAQLNDVTMLLHVSQDHSHAEVISFPRDLFVPIPACPKEDGTGNYSAMSSQKINTTLTYGGVACTALTVHRLTGLDIHYAALLELNGAIQMANAIGGVKVCVATPIRDSQIHFSLDAGEHLLEGREALQFVRTRYGVGDGSDVSRNDNQRVFLSALVRTIKSERTLEDPVKVYGLARAVLTNTRFSRSLNVTTIATIALALKDIPLERIVFVQYPGSFGVSGTQSGVVANAHDAKLLFDAIAADLPLTLTGTTGTGAVVDPNAPGENGPSTEPPSPGNDLALPSSIKGQTAATHTCSAGQ